MNKLFSATMKSKRSAKMDFGYGVYIDDTNALCLRGDIGLYDHVSTDDVGRALRNLKGDGPLTIKLHSDGGDVVEGYAIINMLKSLDRPIHVLVEGLAASMASVIVAIADHVTVYEHSFIMIHRISGSAFGTPEQIISSGETIQKLEDLAIDAYIARTNKTRDEIVELMNRETWFAGSEAKEIGFADEVLAGGNFMPVAANMKNFKNPPRDAIALFSTEKRGNTMLEKLMAQLGLKRNEGETDAELLSRIAITANMKRNENESDESFAARMLAECKPAASQDDPPPVPADPQPGRPRMRADEFEALQAQAAQRERERISGIAQMCATFGVDEAQKNKFIESGASVEHARIKVLEDVALRSLNAVPGGHVTHVDNSQEKRSAVTQALLHRINPDRYQLTDEARNFRGLPLAEMVRRLIGEPARDASPMELARMAMSTSDFPLIFAGVTNQIVRDSYESVNRTFVPFTVRTTLDDFRQNNLASLSGAPELLKKNESGEYQYGSLSETGSSIRLETYGRVLRFTREMLVNNEIGNISKLARSYGAAAASKENDVVWQLLIDNPKMPDGTDLFHSDHGNKGSNAKLSVDSLSAARKAMRLQKNSAGRTMNLEAKYLIVSPTNETLAEQIVAEITPTESQNVNPFSGKLTIIVEPRLEALNSGKTWFLAAEPKLVDTIEYAYLSGQEGVYIDTVENFMTDDLLHKARLDFGAGIVDYRGMYMNAGA